MKKAIYHNRKLISKIVCKDQVELIMLQKPFKFSKIDAEKSKIMQIIKKIVAEILINAMQLITKRW